MARLQLTRLSLSRPPDGGSFVGDPCARRCNGVLGVYSVRHIGGSVVRYLSCNECGWRPDDNKLILPEPNHQRDAPGQMKLFDDQASE